MEVEKLVATLTLARSQSTHTAIASLLFDNVIVNNDAAPNWRLLIYSTSLSVIHYILNDVLYKQTNLSNRLLIDHYRSCAVSTQYLICFMFGDINL